MGRRKINKELAIEIAERLSTAQPRERGEIVEYYMKTYGLSKSHVYRIASMYGFSSGRKERADRGKSRLKEEELKLLAGMMKQTRRKNKTMLMPVTAALNILNRIRRLDGDDTLDVHPATVRRHLKRLNMSKREMLSSWTTDDHKIPSLCVSLKAEFPNQTHIFDITPCIQYFFKPRKGLTQWDMNLELYHGKPENYKKIQRHLLRYVLVDLKSGVYFFKYYYSAGENLADLLDFLYSAWSTKEDFPFCGVPFNLYADKGAANKSQFLRSVCERLGINLLHHTPGNSRAKGIVEERMKFIQEHFESELWFAPASNLDELNAHAYEFLKSDNANRIHTRMKTSRLSVWTSLIRSEHKRLLDCTKEEFLSLAVSEPQKAVVTTYGTIRFNGEEYILHGPVNRGETVLVDYNYFDRNNIRCWKLEDGKKTQEIPVTLIKRNFLGEREDAVVLGKEYKRLPDTPAQKKMKEMDTLDYSKVRRVAFRYDLEEPSPQVAFIERPGTSVFGDGDGEKELVEYTPHEVFKEVRFRLKLKRLTPLQAQLIEKEIAGKNKIPDALVESICQRLKKEEVIEDAEKVEGVG